MFIKQTTMPYLTSENSTSHNVLQTNNSNYHGNVHTLPQHKHYVGVPLELNYTYELKANRQDIVMTPVSDNINMMMPWRDV